MEAPWNSLEITKLIAGLVTPAVLAGLGIYIHRITKRFEHSQWRAQKLIEKRLSVYDDLAPQFNDLLCYFNYVGSWKELDPPTIVAMKRSMDKKIHLAAPLFSQEFFGACENFMQLCFETYSGWGKDARLRTRFERRKEACLNDWKDEWSDCFSSTPADPKEIKAAYNHLMSVFASDIGVHQSPIIPHSGRIPGNIR